MSGEARYLSKSGVPGYVASPAGALHHEPEALSEADQLDLTERVHERVAHDRRMELRMALERVERSAKHYEAQLKHAERQAQRLRRKLSEAR